MPEFVSDENDRAGSELDPSESFSGASIAPRPLRSSELVSSVPMSLSVLFAHAEEIVVPDTTGFPVGSEYEPDELRDALASTANTNTATATMRDEDRTMNEESARAWTLSGRLLYRAHMRALLTFGVMLLAVGCGGDEVVGEWSGQLQVDIGGESIAARVTPAVDAGGGRAGIERICTDNEGYLSAVGDPSGFTFSGHSECSLIATDACDSVRIIYSDATVSTRQADGSLSFTATGTATGCFRSWPVRATFSGVRCPASGCP